MASNSKQNKREIFGKVLQSPTRAFERLFRSGGHSPSGPDLGADPSRKVGSSKQSSLAPKILQGGSNAIPCLKPLVDLLADCFNTVPAVARIRKDYKDMAESINLSIDMLESQSRQLEGGPISERLIDAIGKLRNHATEITKKQTSTIARHYVGAEEDIDDLMKLYHCVASLMQRLQVDVTLSIWNRVNSNFELISDHLANEHLSNLLPIQAARYDSVEASKVGRNGCILHTRQLILQQLDDWSNDASGSKIYLMNGMTGTGKTSIAYTFCSQLESRNQLAASFFCSRWLPNCNNVGNIFTTVAYQLARMCPPFRDLLCQALKVEPHLGDRGVPTQFEKLIYQPMHQVREQIPAGILVVVLDALDECSDQGDALLVVDTILRFASNLPLKFFVTCRPDHNVLATLGSSTSVGSVFHLHDFEPSTVQADIDTYLRFELQNLRPKDEQIKRLVEMSGRLFIYAATMARYIMTRKQSANHMERLRHMLEEGSKEITMAHKPLDALYSTILSAALDDDDLETWEKNNVRVVLHAVICAREPLSIDSLAQVLRIDASAVLCGIESLLSVLHIDEQSGLITTLHASFTDFLLDEMRSHRFHCSLAVQSEYMTRRCFEIMQTMLRFNICGLESSFVLDKAAPNLPHRIKKAIPDYLFYACRYWGEHLIEIAETQNISPLLDDFLRYQALFWVEVINIKGATRAVMHMLTALKDCIKTACAEGATYALFLDVHKFLNIVLLNPVCQSTPHIYVSVLALWDRNAPIWGSYGQRLQRTIRAAGQAIDNRESSALAVWRDKHEIYAMAVSRNGRLIASGGNEGFVTLWDAQSGKILLGPFRAHKEDVFSLAISPDGHQFVSGSKDGTIRIWDTKIGREVMESLQGHTNQIWSITYSPNGKKLASTSVDRMIRIWDLSTGGHLHTQIQGHLSRITCISYSPDGTHIISGLEDGSICIWNGDTGTMHVGPLSAHSGNVFSVAYSPHGKRFASGGEDCAVRVWDSYSGDTLGRSFHGHTDVVRCVSFSSNEDFIVSSSQDRTVRVWDAYSGLNIAGPFTGHTGWVYSVMFMHGDDRVVSGSGDGTIRIWDSNPESTSSGHLGGPIGPLYSVGFSPDSESVVSAGEDRIIRIWNAETGRMKTNPLVGHTGWVFSAVYSPCGNYIASGSEDCTIRMWDARTGNPINHPIEQHKGGVSSIAFSPNSSRFASGSLDSTIRVWDAHTGTLTTKPFNGHRGSVIDVAYSPDAKNIISCSEDHTVRVWDAETGATVAGPFRALSLHITYSSDGTRFLSSCDDYIVSVRDACTGAKIDKPCRGHTDWVRSAVFSPKDLHILSGSYDCTIRIFDAHTGQPVTSPVYAHINRVTSVAFSPNGRLMASCSFDGSVRIWDFQQLTSSPPKDLSWWTMDKDGWILGHDSSLLLWVPPDLRTGLLWPQSVAVMDKRGCWGLDFTDAYMGTEWAKCFVTDDHVNRALA